MRSKAIAVGCSSALALGLLTAAAPAMAGEKQINDDISLKWNLKASVGAISRMESARKENLFAGDTPGGTSSSAVSDDGNLNYDGGEVVSAVAKAVGDVNLQYRNYGLFVRAKGWYDYVQKEKDVPHGNFPNEFVGGEPLSDDGFDRNSKFQGATFQDVFVHGTFQVNEQPLKLKAGRQTLLWGRSLYSRGSLSALNAIDLAALHRPGAEYTEFLKPAGMVTADYQFTDRLSMKSFYQYEWRAANLDGCGTFFSTLDNTAVGCDATFSSSVIIPNKTAFENGLYIPRRDEKEPDDGGQYGLKFDYAFPKSKAKVGAYFLNYHMRLPIYSVTKEDSPLAQGITAGNDIAYFYEYPEDIQVIGLTADKTFEGIGNLAMNLSYLPDMPVQINTPDLTTSRVLEANGVPAAAAQGFATVPQDTIDYVYGSGNDVTGFKEFDIQRAEFTFTTVIPKVLGAQKTIVSAQVGSEFIQDLPDQEDMRFRRHTNFGVGDLGEDGYVTDFSWGYQLTLKSTYANAIGPVTLTPSLTLQHGVEGYSSDDALQEDQRSLGLGIGMGYKKLSADLSYTTYNDASYSVVNDRDYLSLSTTYNF
ncbi:MULTISPECIES: DUF1302 domain-containing protein [unclassified Alcanivorax]|uniref:DUF1302 domain-containing protein n=2 Tax=Alcanivorax TaxID=59753 RepID=UPI0007B82F1B|nr:MULTISPECIES: DUF1302 domain-containing protein [unclassified Alcanivorax]KZX74474.1 hypothetical protein A3717_03035 [Alcanivorax sp. HI0013]KZX76909.1 hypothetical protein A3716_09720 [Alcanivorax sp. HI0011]KZY14014.1 hypothetical protein A3725_01065 [Alcanivorax sp. HI0035]KZX63483.1 hypothetical protein A3713_05650 [Alcanivorax sp. HI0003]KZX66705.1 hypothetical protein A3714_12750 [Alcanivorax sp. HI0007]